jgi:hypothetical protein
MAWRIVKQPNGKFARFSEVVDNFTHYDMTKEQAIDLCCDYMGRLEAPAKVENAINSPKRYQESLDIIREIHGVGEAEKIRQTIEGPSREADNDRR